MTARREPETSHRGEQGIDMESHITDQVLENAHWLMDEYGMHISLVARRLGISESGLVKKLEREKKGRR